MLVDRVLVEKDIKSRLLESVELALSMGNGTVSYTHLTLPTN